MTMTTIKVPAELRDRINAEAHQHSVTAASLIETLLDSYVRQARLEQFGKAMSSADDEYWDEFNEWDVGLAPSDGFQAHDGSEHDSLEHSNRTGGIQHVDSHQNEQGQVPLEQIHAVHNSTSRRGDR